MPPRLIDILTALLQSERYPLDDLHVYVQEAEGRLWYRLTWGEQRYVEGSFVDWAEVQQVYEENPAHLRGRVHEWAQLIASIQTPTTPTDPIEQWNLDLAASHSVQTPELINRFGGRSLVGATLREGLEVQPLERPPEPLSDIDRVIAGRNPIDE